MGDWAPWPEQAPTEGAPAVGPAVRLVVDGEEFDVRERPDRPGQYDFAWVSGPNAGYGFTSARSDGAPETRAGLQDLIRNFLAQVDPGTGFIE